MQQYDVAIVGGGIVGLGHAYAAAKRGKSVVLFERSARAQGASVRNFGMVWPIGLKARNLALGLRGRDLWCEVLDDAGLPYAATGSLHLLYREDEEAVVREFIAKAPSLGYECEWHAPGEVLGRSPAANPTGLRGAMWSPMEITVDSRLVVGEIPGYLSERFDVTCHFSEPVRSVSAGVVETAQRTIKAEQVYICSGIDFETLYPEVFAAEPLKKTKLQMMRTGSQPGDWRLGPSLAAGLTLQFYPAFEICDSLPALKARIAAEMPEYNRWGIHVMVAETSLNEMTLGDSHEYDLALEPFDKPEIDELILKYLAQFARFPKPEIAQRWHGIYARHATKDFIEVDAEPNVRIAMVTGGKGMTLSFAFGEKMVTETLGLA
ncbi:MAG: TIGR03364 family FAD-dependent oxidoreductase [Acidobacteria bacterium]|nr:TIGR03364 family FAD-dependent oxidoreductase [Acidobacteriota bacterium]